jgi:hypothetical protein
MSSFLYCLDRVLYGAKLDDCSVGRRLQIRNVQEGSAKDLSNFERSNTAVVYGEKLPNGDKIYRFVTTVY